VEVEGQQGDSTLTTRRAPYHRKVIHAELILSRFAVHDIQILLAAGELTVPGKSHFA